MLIRSRLAILSLALVACDPPSAPTSPSATGTPSVTSEPAPSTTSPVASATATATAAPTAPVAPPASDAVKKLAAASNQLGFDLYKRRIKDPGNVILSPSSITTALAMTWGGARAETAAQMKKVLHFEGTPQEVMETSGRLTRSLEDPSRPIVFRVANQLFGEKTYTFERAFLDETKNAYGAPLEAVDFVSAHEPARQRINQWVEQRTEKRIKDLVPKDGVTKDTRLVLVNAIYFLGDWAAPFKKEQTQDQPFNVSASEKKNVPTMIQRGSFRFGKKDAVSALELPYKGGDMSMLLLVPERVDGLAALEGSLDAKKLDGWVGALKDEQVAVYLPKFEVAPTAPMRLADDLRALGMPIAFDRGKADFTGIANPPSPQDRLYIGNVFHKGFVKVDEKGTEAAAATAVAMPKGGSAPAPVTEVRIDRPFLFVIRDAASGLVLFMGRVNDPTQK